MPGQGKGGSNSNPGNGKVIVDLPPQAGTFDLTMHIEGFDFGSGKWYSILVGANITSGNSNQRLRVGTDVADVANVSANDLLPYMWRVRMVHGDAEEILYSVAFELS
jgi:hypothetical protein